MSFEKEKHYIVNYLMNTVLGLGVKIENSYYDTRYQFLFGGKILEFKDDFFRDLRMNQFLIFVPKIFRLNFFGLMLPLARIREYL